MKKDYNSTGKLLKKTRFHFFVSFLILTLAFSNHSLGQVATGTNVCEGGTLYVKVQPSKAGPTFGLYRVVNGTYTKVDESYSPSNNFTFTGQTVVGKYEVWGFTGYPPAPADPTATGTHVNDDHYVYANPTPVISGLTAPCLNSTPTYSIADNGGSGYTWVISSNGSGSSTTNSIDVNWTATGAGSVTLTTYTDAHGCSPSGSTVLNVDVKALPTPTITGDNHICATTQHTYSTETGMTNYQWSTDGTVISGGGTSDNSITISWANGGTGNVSVNYTNSNGCTAASSTSFSVTVDPTPVVQADVTDPDGNITTMSSGNNYSMTICSGEAVTTGDATSSSLDPGACGQLWVEVVSTTNISTLPPSTTQNAPVSATTPPTTITPENHDGVAKNITFISTPYYDVDASGTLTAGDVTGAPVTFVLTVQPTPVVQADVTYPDGTVVTMSSGNNYATTICSGEAVTTGDATSSSVDPGACGPLWVEVDIVSTLPNIPSSTQNAPVGPDLGSTTITPENHTSADQTLTFTSTPYYDADASGSITPGDVTGAPVTFVVTVQPTPEVHADVTDPDGNITPMSSGNNYSMTICSGEEVSTGAAQSNSANPGACGNLWVKMEYISTLPNIPSSSFALPINDPQNVGSTISPENHTGSDQTITFYSIPFYEVDGVSGLTSGDVIGDSIKFILTVHPELVPTLTGLTSVCANTTQTYTTDSGMSDYSWTITGGTGTSTSNTIDVTWNNTPGSSHSVSVSYTDGNGCTETATLDVTVEGMVQNTTTGIYYCTIQDAIDAASAGDNILLLADITEDMVTIDKALTLDGGNFKLTSTSATYGIWVSGIENVTINNITVDNPETYGIQVSPGSHHLTISNVTAQNCGTQFNGSPFASGFGINCSDHLVLSDIKSFDNEGNGLVLDGCNDVTITNIETSGNSFDGNFGAGIEIAGSGAWCTPGSSSNIVIQGTVNISENPEIYETGDVTNVTLPVDYTHFVGSLLPRGKSYNKSLNDALTAVAAIFNSTPGVQPVTYVEEITSGNLYVASSNETGINMSIQAAATAADDNVTINIYAGHFEEQVEVKNKTVTITGAGIDQTYIESPLNMDISFTTSADNYCIIWADTASMTLTNLTVDGLDRGNTNYKMAGVGFRNAGGTVDNCKIINIENTPFSGAQHGASVYLYNNDGIARNVAITNNQMADFQKTAIVVIDIGGDSDIDISGNTITGHGATDITAQNGIQLYATSVTTPVTVTGNTISGIAYDNTNSPTKWVATSILNYTNANISSNTITGAHMAIYNIDAPCSIASNNITIEKVGVYAFGIVGSDPPQAVPSPMDIPDKGKAGQGGKATFDVDISDNTLQFSGSDNTSTYAIEVDAGWEADSYNVTGSGNDVSGFEYGFIIYQCQSGCDAGLFTGVDFEDNKIYGNTYGMYSNVDYLTVDATHNYWGDASGPYNDPFNTCGTGNGVDGNIAFNPWWVDNGMTTENGDLPVHNVTQNSYYCTIQDAVASANKNDVIEVAAGTYTLPTPYLSIDSSMTIKGAKYGVDPTNTSNGRAALTYTGESVIEGILFVNENVSNVTIDGFYFDYDGTSNVWGDPTPVFLYHAVSDITISNNVFEGIDYSGTVADLNDFWNSGGAGYKYAHGVVTTYGTNQATNVTVTKNLFEGWYGSTYINSGATNLVITYNKVDNNVNAFRIDGGNGVTIEHNTIDHSAGLDLMAWGGSITSLSIKYNSFSNYPAAFGALYTYIKNRDPAKTIDLVGQGNIFDGKTIADMTYPDDFFVLEGLIRHSIDRADYGFINIMDNNVFVNPPIPDSDLGIQQGINVAQAGWTVNVNDGTYTENLTIDKSLSIKGRTQNGVVIYPALSAPNPGGGGSLPAGASNLALIQADDVTLDHLTFDGDNPDLTSGTVVNGADIDARNGIIQDYTAGNFTNLNVNHVTVKNIYLRGIYATTGGYFEITYNTVTNVAGEAASIPIMNWSGTGLFAHNTVSNSNDGIVSNHSKGVVYEYNTVTNCGSGIHTDNNGDATGATADTIRYNTVTNGSPNSFGIWVFASRLNNSVYENTVSNVYVGLCASGQIGGEPEFYNNTVENCDYGVYTTTSLFGWGSDNCNVTFENNFIDNCTSNGFECAAEAGYTNNTTAHENHITGNHGATASGDGTLNIDLECNWWGSTDPSTIAGMISGDVDVNPYLTDGTDNDSGTPGFQPVPGSCGGVFPVHNVTQDTYFVTIQDAVDAAVANDSINVAAGTYTEQVYVSVEGLSIAGAGTANTTIVSPATLTNHFNSGTKENYPVVFIENVANVKLYNLTVDGDGQGNNNFRFMGIGFWNAGGTINNVNVLDIMETPFSGTQHGFSVYAFNNTYPGNSYTVTINGMNIDGFQKDALFFVGPGLTVNVSNVDIYGEGPTSITGQNGIDILDDVAGTISNCYINGINYTGANWTATGFLVRNCTDLIFTGSVMDACQTGIYFVDGGGLCSYDTIINPVGDGAVVYNTATKSSQKPKLLPFGAKENMNFENGKGNDTISFNSCVFTGALVPSMYGISGFATEPIIMNVENSKVTNWEIGVLSYNYGATIMTTANNNDLSGNTAGFYTNETVAQNVKDNWWGHETGPYNDPHNTCGQGSEVYSVVDGMADFYEWWADAAMTTRYTYPLPTLANCPANVTLNQEDERGAYATGTPTATTCYGPVEITYSDDRTQLTSCNATGYITRTFTATDYFGHESTCQQILTIQDNTAPVAIPPDDITQDNDPGLCSAVVDFETSALDFGFFQGFEHSGWESVQGSGWYEYNSTITSEPSYGSVTPKTGTSLGLINSTGLSRPPSNETGVFSRLGGYNDIPNSFGDGFITSVDIYIDLNDPANAAGNYGWDLSSAVSKQTGYHLQDFTFHATAYQNGSVLIHVDNQGYQGSGPMDPATVAANYDHAEITSSGWYTFEMDFKDDGTNHLEAVCNIYDSSGNLIWTYIRNSSHIVSNEVAGNLYMWFIFITPDHLAIDNTSLYRKPFTTSAPASGNAFNVGTTQVTVTATDACGNSGGDNFNVTVNDTEAPVAKCQDVTVYLDANGETSVTADDVDNGSTDNCGIASLELDQYDFDCSDLGFGVPVELTVTDIHGNTDQCQATITVSDNIAPTVSCPGDQTVCADETINDTYTTSGTEFDYTDAQDNCSVSNVDYELTGATTGNGTGTLDGVAFNEGVTTVTWTATDQSGNTGQCSFTVTVNPAPDPQITGNLNPIGGTTEVYQTTYVAGHTYVWTVTGATSYVVNPSPNDYYCEVVWGPTGTGTVSVTETNTATGCEFTDQISVTITPVALQGTITYKNNSGTPMSNITVRVKNGATVVATTTTDASGHYQFNTLSNGSYTLEVETAKDWGGANSTDALAIQRTALNYNFPWWTPADFVDNVGDVNGSGTLSSLDALQVKQRAVYMINSFNAGDWAFWDVTGTTNFTNTSDNVATLAYTHSGATTLNIQSMCYGDVNASFTPGSNKSPMLFAIESNNEINVQENKEFILPVKLMNEAEIGAMTIFITYPDNIIEINDLKTSIPGMLYTIGDGWINVAWSEVEPLNIPSGGTLFTLVCSASAKVNNYMDLFMQSDETEFSDINCKVLNNVTLNIDKVNVLKSDADLSGLYALNCYPNPLKHSTKIAYTIPENGQVQIVVTNSLGMVVTKVIDDTKDAGDYVYDFKPADYGLGTGVYYVRMVVQGETSNYSNAIRIVYMK